MPVRTIVKWPSSCLSNVTQPIGVVDESVISLAADLRDTMYTAFGAGLAAPQVGISKSICVIEHVLCESSDLPVDPILLDVVVLVNPIVTVLGEKTFRWREACLSIDSFEAVVTRYNDIHLDYLNLLGEEKSITLWGQIAGVVQHETDHLSGNVFIDRLSSRKRSEARRHLLKRIRTKRLVCEKEAKLHRREILRRGAAAVDTPRSGYRLNSAKPAKPNSKKKRKSKTYGKNKSRKK